MEWLDTKSPRLILTGGARLLIENHLGIRALMPDRVAIDTASGALIILGHDLMLRAAADCALMLSGDIKTIHIGGDDP